MSAVSDMYRWKVPAGILLLGMITGGIGLLLVDSEPEAEGLKGEGEVRSRERRPAASLGSASGGAHSYGSADEA